MIKGNKGMDGAIIMIIAVALTIVLVTGFWTGQFDRLKKNTETKLNVTKYIPTSVTKVFTKEELIDKGVTDYAFTISSDLLRDSYEDLEASNPPEKGLFLGVGLERFNKGYSLGFQSLSGENHLYLRPTSSSEISEDLADVKISSVTYYETDLFEDADLEAIKKLLKGKTFVVLPFERSSGVVAPSLLYYATGFEWRDGYYGTTNGLEDLLDDYVVSELVISLKNDAEISFMYEDGSSYTQRIAKKSQDKILIYRYKTQSSDYVVFSPVRTLFSGTRLKNLDETPLIKTEGSFSTKIIDNLNELDMLTEI